MILIQSPENISTWEAMPASTRVRFLDFVRTEAPMDSPFTPGDVCEFIGIYRGFAVQFDRKRQIMPMFFRGVRIEIIQ